LNNTDTDTSQAIKLGDLLFCSGCIPLDPTTAEVVDGGIEAQTEQALKNMTAVLEAGGSELNKVVKTTVRLSYLPTHVLIHACDLDIH
jgi:enamine deaminase RidA (YjgF/YER057c/UK114 family)